LSWQPLNSSITVQQNRRCPALSELCCAFFTQQRKSSMWFWPTLPPSVSPTLKYSNRTCETFSSLTAITPKSNCLSWKFSLTSLQSQLLRSSCENFR
uniref:Ovule protein n=1 Tax=Schistocephalus solidus TaxID=70667 RepID=A0A183TTA0_SCHSO